MKRPYLRKIALAIVFGVTGILFFNIDEVTAKVKERYSKLQLFAKVLNLVQQYYVEEVNTEKLIYGGIKGMLSELDPHTNFLPPEIFKEFESETSGEFGGLGIEITLKNDVLTVISPIEDTPAWKAGIKAGDRVVGINSESTKGFSLAEAAQRMKGKNGTNVTLSIFREGFDSPKDFVIKRAVVKLRSVKYTDLKDGYGYFRVTSFMETTTKEFKKYIERHRKKYKVIKGIIIDLRKNPGGLLDQAVSMGDLFLEKGIIVSTVDRNKKAKEYLSAKKQGTLEGFPVVILMDEYSASASEILAGALQDHKRALIMGERSFGKGSVQSVVKLGDGSALKLTVARYFTPKGRSIQAEGIMPDVVLEKFDSKLLDKARVKKSVRREKDIKGHLLSEKEKKKKKTSKVDFHLWWGDSKKSRKHLSPKDKLLSEDFQVLQAYNYLKAWKVMKAN